MKLTLALTTVLLASTALAQPTINWHTIAPGGTLSSGPYTLASAIAQPAAGTISSATYSLTGGFLVGQAAIGCGTSDYNGDGDFGTDADIEAFFACLGGSCCQTCFPGGSDFNADGDYGTDADIEAFFRVLAGGNC
jgi:hypothetical protein